MIVIFCDNIDDFIVFLEKKIMNEIFYEIKDIKNHITLSNGINSEIVLHFLAKISNTLILYETKQNITKSSDSKNREEVLQSLQHIFNQVDPSLKLVKGKIREIFLSYSS
ncbi:MAG: hypothetical protein HWN81_18580 [Candidatus Lokiarchaeota archaeon]|nr:hypothetical protein [Candidatus Lokiarchaeota archaeon]